MPKVTAVATQTKAGAKKKSTGNAWDDIEDLQVDDFLKINIYGKSGTGKTRLWATFPKPALVLLVSGGKRPGELKSINTPENRASIKQKIVTSSTDIKEIVDKQNETGRFKTIVLDHATDLQNLVLREVLGVTELPEQLGWGVATQQDWGQVALQMKELLRALLDGDNHAVIVAQERVFDETEEGGDIIMPYVGSALSPSVTGWLMPACDYVVQTYKKGKTVTKEVKIAGKVKKQTVKVPGVDYCLRTGPDETFMTKFRVPPGIELVDHIINPTFDKILSISKTGKC